MLSDESLFEIECLLYSYLYLKCLCYFYIVHVSIMRFCDITVSEAGYKVVCDFFVFFKFIVLHNITLLIYLAQAANPRVACDPPAANDGPQATASF